MLIRVAVHADIPYVAEIHKAQFSDHYLGHYSEKLIGRFYEAYLESCVFLVSEDENYKINGFVLGGNQVDLTKAKEAFVSKNIIRCAFETLFKPSLYLKAMSKIGVLRKSNPPIPSNLVSTEAPKTRLLSIAVSDTAKGSGVSSALLKNFENQLDTNTYGLSVKQLNQRAIKFYTKNGFELLEERNGSLSLLKQV